MTEQPIDHNRAARLSCLRPAFQVITKVKMTMVKNGATSSVENSEPIHCQYPGAPIQ
ncbi:hypothetical protein D3C71_2059660 [compost metagenome]